MVRDMANSIDRREPIPTNAAKDRIHAFAESIALQLKFAPGDALEPVVASLGGKISYHTPTVTGAHPPESIVVSSNKKFVIFIPSTTSPQRDRFTIAHELGHLFLHFPLVQQKYPGSAMVATRWVRPGDPDQQRAEWEANWFAAAFLMPLKPFKAALRAWSNDMTSVASDFGVSVQAAEVRARSIA